MNPLLIDVINGLMPIHLATQAGMSAAERQTLGERYADELAAGADRLTAPGNFDDRHERSRALTALAGGIALGAVQSGGTTWASHHWCTAPHDDCAVNPVNERSR